MNFFRRLSFSRQQPQQQSDFDGSSYNSSQQPFPQQSFPQQSFPQQSIPQQSFPQQSIPQQSDQTEKAIYDLSADIVRDRLKQENAEDVKILESLDKSEIIVVRGAADHIENVLTAISVPHIVIDSQDIVKYNFKPSQTLYINCHTSAYPSGTGEVLKKFVNSGGQLITTDWSVNNLLSTAFPGTIDWNNQSTQDEAVDISCSTEEDEVLKSFKDEKLWYLAGGSHPIRVIDPHKVKVLISSEPLSQKYGSNAILVRFEHGEGVVYHMISHFHLNMNRGQTPQHANNMRVDSYISSKGGSVETQQKMAKLQTEYGESLNYGNVQSCTTNAEFVMRSAIKQKKKFY